MMCTAPDSTRRRQRTPECADSARGTGEIQPGRWSLNGDFVTLAPNGVARYARETVAALDMLIAERHPLTLGLDIDLVVPRSYSGTRYIPTRVVPEFRSPRLPQVWVQAQLPRAASGGVISFCNLAPAFWKRHIACIHDLHTFLMPESYDLGFRLAHHALLPRIGRNAAFITTVSTLSRDHIVAHGIAPANKVVVTYNGADHALRWRPERSLLFSNAPTRPFIFALGRAQAYKNTGLVVRLAERLDAHGLDVYMAGDIDPGALTSEVGPLPPNLRLLGRIDDDDLAAAFRHASAFVFPSRIEGFGLPAVEAMTLGCPVIASTAPCLPEVCGDGALYADVDDINGWLEAILRLRGDPAMAAELAAKGRMQARRYTWRGIAETYLRLMHEVDDRFRSGAQLSERQQTANRAGRATAEADSA